MQHKICIYNNYLHIIQKIRSSSRAGVVAFVYLGGYWWLNEGNLNMIKRGNKQACLAKGSYAGGHTRWRGLGSYLSAVVRHESRL